jgi:hypothetical protein
MNTLAQTTATRAALAQRADQILADAFAKQGRLDEPTESEYLVAVGQAEREAMTANTPSLPPRVTAEGIAALSALRAADPFAAARLADRHGSGPVASFLRGDVTEAELLRASLRGTAPSSDQIHDRAMTLLGEAELTEESYLTAALQAEKELLRP